MSKIVFICPCCDSVHIMPYTYEATRILHHLGIEFDVISYPIGVYTTCS